MIPVIIESPFAGDEGIVARNRAYLCAAMHDCLLRGEAPFASHGLYTQPGVLDDTKPEERRLGIEAGFAWRALAKKTIVYIDFGVTKGMLKGINHAIEHGHEVVMRSLRAWKQDEPLPSWPPETP